MELTQFIQNSLPTISEKSILNTIKCLDNDFTIPFISRYRKEMTGNLDEVEISAIKKLKNQYQEIIDRKTYILQTISESNLMTPELESKINKTFDLTLLEDIYLPFKKKKKTKATIAKEKGLEPLAKIIMKQNMINDLDLLISKYITNEVPTNADALEGVNHIIAEWINENEYVRNRLREMYRRQAIISSKVVKAKIEDEGAKIYTNYFEYEEPLKKCASHRLLAMLRGEREGYLKLTIAIDKKDAFKFLEYTLVKSLHPFLLVKIVNIV